jgi:ubiquinone/menaquinone biosynthesis C-methylase UbiE
MPACYVWPRPIVGPKIDRCMTERPYVLSTGLDELERLALQHRLWSDATVAAWHKAGLTAGSRVLDVGCGPGYAAFDLAQFVTPRGEVLGIDESATFVQHVREQARLRGLPQLRAEIGDAHALANATEAAHFDFAYARWVLCFVRDPEAVLRGIAHALRSDGRLVVHDYFNYGAMTPAPRSAAHDRAVQATIRSWKKHGGDPDVVGRLPALLEATGFRVEHVTVHQRVARGTDSMFAWPDTWWRTYAPKLVAMGELTDDDCSELLRDLDALRKGPGFFHCPPVYEVIARRR